MRQNVLKSFAAAGLCAAFLPSAGMGEGVISLPLADAGEGLDLGQGYVLSPDRLDPDRHRGTYFEDADPEHVDLSPLHPNAVGTQVQNGVVRLSGERQALEFSVFVADPASVKSLRISTLSSVNLLPETSHMVVTLNGQRIGETSLGSFVDFTPSDFPVSPEMLRAGRNQVRIELVQKHRIYCGPFASFALWSDVNLAKSGLTLSGGDPQSGPEAFMMGVAAVAATGDGLEVRGADIAAAKNPALVKDVARSLSRSLGGDPLAFRFTDYWSLQKQSTPAARVTFVPSDATRVLFQRAGDGAEVMVVEYGPTQTAQTLPDLPALLPAPMPDSPLTLIDTMRPVRFADFGFAKTEIRDRHTRINQDFLLPEDYVVLNSEKAEIQLDYAYLPDLPRGAILLLSVNGETVTALTLTGEGTRARAKSTLWFEARRLRPGVNEIGFEVLIPGSPEDQACPSHIEPFLIIGENSTLHAPYAPSFYVPDMHKGLAGLTAADVHVAPLAAGQFAPTDLLSIMAALNGDSAGSGDPIPARLELMSLEDLVAAAEAPYKPALRAVEIALGPVPVKELSGKDTPELVYLTPRDRFDPVKLASATWQSITGRVQSTVDWALQRDKLSLNEWLETQRGQAILIQPDPAKAGELVMLRSENSDVTRIASALAAGRVGAHGPRGQVSVLDHDGQWHSWQDPHLEPILLEPINKDNIRHVVGSYASVMPGGYVALVFLIAFLAGVVALRLTLSTREIRK